MASRKVVLRVLCMALQAASLATLDLRLTTLGRSASVRFVCPCMNGPASIEPYFSCTRNNFIENTCVCNNGVMVTGAECPVNGIAKCKSCKSGWTIGNAGTECIRTLYLFLRDMAKDYFELIFYVCIIFRECLHMQERRRGNRN